MLTQKLMEVANQNLGILLYEDLVNHYSEVLSTSLSLCTAAVEGEVPNDDVVL
jgi:hypothetical protein